MLACTDACVHVGMHGYAHACSCVGMCMCTTWIHAEGSEPALCMEIYACFHACIRACILFRNSADNVQLDIRFREDSFETSGGHGFDDFKGNSADRRQNGAQRIYIKPAGPSDPKACEITTKEQRTKLHDFRTEILIISCLHSKQAFGETSKSQVPKKTSTNELFSKC